MKELTIISGKGGTGKTSVVASFAALAQNKVLPDADVDAADLDLILTPEIKHEEDFKGGRTAQIDLENGSHVRGRSLCDACSVSWCGVGAFRGVLI